MRELNSLRIFSENLKDVIARVEGEKSKESDNKERRMFYKKVNEEVESVIREGKKNIQEAKEQGANSCRITPISHVDYVRWEDSKKELSEGMHMFLISESRARRKKSVLAYIDLTDMHLHECLFNRYFRQAVSYEVAFYFIKQGYDVYQEPAPVVFYNNGDKTIINFITVTW